MATRGRLKNYEKARIIELFIYHKKTLKQISEIMDVCIQTVSMTVSLYFKKPKFDKTLTSKV